MDSSMQDFGGPFDQNNMFMPIDGDFDLDSNYAALDFNEAEFADLGDQEIRYDENGYIVNNADYFGQVNPLPVQSDDSDAAFIAEVMAGAQQDSMQDANAISNLGDFESTFINYDGTQSDSQAFETVLDSDDYYIPPLQHTQPLGSMIAIEQPNGRDSELVPAIVDPKLLPSKSSLETVGSNKSYGEASPKQAGCIAPPSTPMSMDKTSSALLRRAPLTPESSPRPARKVVPVYRNATVPISPMQQIDIAVRPSLTTSYQRRFDNFDTARQALTGPGEGETLVKLPLATEDDWQHVKEQQVHGFAAQIYDAVQAEPGEPPQGFTDFQRAYYYGHQAKVLSNIKEQIAAKPAEAEARVFLAFEEVINLHQRGLPEAVLNRRNTTGSTFAVEINFICSARAEKIIEIAAIDKYVALDILNGTNLSDLVRSPIKYLERKRQNSRVNAKKAENKRLAAQAQTAPTTARNSKRSAAKAPPAVNMPTAAPEGSRAATPVTFPATPMPRPRAGPAPRIKATLKRKVVGEGNQAAAKKAKHQDGDEEMADA